MRIEFHLEPSHTARWHIIQRTQYSSRAQESLVRAGRIVRPRNGHGLSVAEEASERS